MTGQNKEILGQLIWLIVVNTDMFLDGSRLPRYSALDGEPLPSPVDVLSSLKSVFPLMSS